MEMEMKDELGLTVDRLAAAASLLEQAVERLAQRQSSFAEDAEASISRIVATVESRREADLEAKLAAEKDPLVRQDLEILMAAADREVRAIDANQKTFLPYVNAANLIFYGEKTLLDDQVYAARRPAAVDRDGDQHPVAPGHGRRLVEEIAVRADGRSVRIEDAVVVEVGPDRSTVVG